MTAALRYEWVRIRTLRSTYWITALAVVLAVGISFLMAMGFSFALASGDEDPTLTGVLGPAIATQFAAVTGPYFVAYLLGIIGVFAWGHEYRHGTIRATLTAVPSRSSAWTAKYLVAVGWALPVVLVALLGSSLVGWLWLRDDGIAFASAAMAEQYARTLAYSVVFVLLVTAVASLVRSQTAALTLMFLWPLVVEPMIGLIMVALPGTTLDRLARLLPFDAGDQIHRVDLPGNTENVLGGPALADWAGGLVFGGLTAVLMVLSWALFQRRDA